MAPLKTPEFPGVQSHSPSNMMERLVVFGYAYYVSLRGTFILWILSAMLREISAFSHVIRKVGKKKSVFRRNMSLERSSSGRTTGVTRRWEDTTAYRTQTGTQGTDPLYGISKDNT
jgi:hypothetical protein